MVEDDILFTNALVGKGLKVPKKFYQNRLTHLCVAMVNHLGNSSNHVCMGVHGCVCVCLCVTLCLCKCVHVYRHQ